MFKYIIESFRLGWRAESGLQLFNESCWEWEREQSSAELNSKRPVFVSQPNAQMGPRMDQSSCMLGLSPTALEPHAAVLPIGKG